MKINPKLSHTSGDKHFFIYTNCQGWNEEEPTKRKWKKSSYLEFGRAHTVTG